MASGRTEKSQLKRGRVRPFTRGPLIQAWTDHYPQASAGEGDQDTKKPRRSDRISSQNQTTPLKNKSFLPSPLTHRESTATEHYKEATVTPPVSDLEPADHRTPASSPARNQALSSPPSDTQVLSQFVYPPTSLSLDVEDEEAEGVWGYLVPLDSAFGDTLVLRKRTACPAPYPNQAFGQGSEQRSKGQCGRRTYNEEEQDYELNKRDLGWPAGGYLIGRHPECGRSTPTGDCMLRLISSRPHHRLSYYLKSPLYCFQRDQGRNLGRSSRRSVQQRHLCR